MTTTTAEVRELAARLSASADGLATVVDGIGVQFVATLLEQLDELDRRAAGPARVGRSLAAVSSLVVAVRSSWRVTPADADPRVRAFRAKLPELAKMLAGLAEDFDAARADLVGSHALAQNLGLELRKLN